MIGLAAAAILATLWAMMPLETHDILIARVEDQIMRAAAQISPPQEAASSVIVVDLDDEALERLGPWPPPRARLAEIVTRVNAFKPRAIALDMFFDGLDPRSPVAEARRRGVKDEALLNRLGELTGDGDAALASALDATPSVIGLLLDPERAGAAPGAPVLSSVSVPSGVFWEGAGVAAPPQSFLETAAGLGVVALPGDADGVTRRVPLLVEAGRRPYPGLAAEALRVAQNASAYIVDGANVMIGNYAVPLGPDGMLRLAPGAGRTRRISAARLLDGEPLPEGALILIGASAAATGALRVAQDDAMTPSTSLHARALAQIEQGPLPRPPAWPRATVAAALAAWVGLSLLAAMRASPTTGVLWMTGVNLAAVGSSVGAFLAGGWLYAPILPAAAGNAAYLAAALAAFASSRRREARMRRRFEQYLAPGVVAIIAADPEAVKLSGERRVITSLFTDIEGFSAMTARVPPEALLGALDGYFEGIAGLVLAQGGMIDKIVGDAVHAVFNAPLDLPDHAAHALSCAKAIADWTQSYRARPEIAALGFGPTRLGLESGEAVVGDVGLRSKLDYTAYGSVVNAAARLEAANKLFGSTICVGPNAAASIGETKLRPLGEIELRGVTEAAQVFTTWPESVEGEWRAEWERAVSLEGVAAAGRLRALAARADDDPVALGLARRLEGAGRADPSCADGARP